MDLWICLGYLIVMLVSVHTNQEERCHALAITVGGGDCPLCDTSVMSMKKGGAFEAKGGVGACKVEKCQFNESLECTADSIHVGIHDNHPECCTFEAK